MNPMAMMMPMMMMWTLMMQGMNPMMNGYRAAVPMMGMPGMSPMTGTNSMHGQAQLNQLNQAMNGMNLRTGAAQARGYGPARGQSTVSEQRHAPMRGAARLQPMEIADDELHTDDDYVQ